VFDFLQEHGNIEVAEMRRTFNCGVGMVVVVPATDAKATIAALNANGESAWRIGTIVEGGQEVQYA
jgi:phosphoribosylformylglycinamidine cyclo-ligase